MIEAIPKSKKNKRCQLHSLDTHKPKPLGGNWIDIWEVMSQECRDEVVLIDSNYLLETLENYLRKHRFCTDCKNKVLRAYNILIGDLDCSKEKGYCAALYEGLRCCAHERHIHVCCETDFIAHLLGRAEPEFAGAYERRERHAKTIDIAQEEVLTCLGIHLYERLHRIWQKLRAEEQTWQMLFYLGVDALRKSFEMTVEKVQGISQLEQLCEEFLEEERVQELKQEKKRQKKKNRRKNKCVCAVPVSASIKEMAVEKDDTSGYIEMSCNSCSGSEDNNGFMEVAIASENSACSSCTCPSRSGFSSPHMKKGLTACSNVSDCGYSSSMEGSESGSREGSDVACTEGICNHDEAGEDQCTRCDKEEEDGDSCVECWANSTEDRVKDKNRKKKKCKPFKCGNEITLKQGICLQETSNNALIDQSTNAKVDRCSTLESTRQTCTGHRRGVSEFARALHSFEVAKEPKSLKELLDESECTSEEEDGLSQDEIQAFLANNQLFYSKRQQFRQYLKEKFYKYCLLHDHRNTLCSSWLATAGALIKINYCCLFC